MPQEQNPLLSTMLQKAEGIGPTRIPEMTMTEAGVPNPRSGLWQMMAMAKRGMPEFQEMKRYLPLTPVGNMAKSGARLHEQLVKRIMDKFPHGPSGKK